MGIQFSKLLEARQEEVAAQAWIAGHTPCGHWYPKRLAKQAVPGYHHEIAMDFEGVYNQTSLVRRLSNWKEAAFKCKYPIYGGNGGDLNNQQNFWFSGAGIVSGDPNLLYRKTLIYCK